MNLDVVYQMYLSLNEDEKNEFLNRLNDTVIQLNPNDDFKSIVLEHSNNPLGTVPKLNPIFGTYLNYDIHHVVQPKRTHHA